ncbi:CD225/dispanin family protein [Amycolatopsis sp. NEAU-NG30]|uniref:CD225/dispanin family protein n=1 Tax=Amycolatopsis melonis TaxID=3156488 RepID=A0ABV0LF58_9PSEU
MTWPYPQYPPPSGPPPETNLVWAILATIMCCVPLGIVAIVKANQVNTLWYQGYHAEAQRSADDARKWAMWAAISAAAVVALYLLAAFLVFVLLGVSLWGAAR